MTAVTPNNKPTENIFRLRYWFGEIDTRWLAIFRILLGLLLLKDALYHLPLARLFYSDAGIIPRRALFDGLVRAPRFSLMDSIGQPWMAELFFCVWVIVLLSLMVGYRVRWMTVLNFVIILSVHERNGYILTGADTLMRVMSFWLMFAPVGQHYALDALRRPSIVSRKTAFALPVRMVQWQLVLVYCSTAYLKAIGEIWRTGQTMHYITQIETFILPVGVWLGTWPDPVLRGLSYGVMVAEFAIPILLLSPFFWRWMRALAFILAVLLHGGIAVTMSIPDFSILMLICYVPFFPPLWLDWLVPRLRPLINKVGNRLRPVLAIVYTSPPPRPRWHLAEQTKKQLLTVILVPMLGLVVLWNIDESASYRAQGFDFPRPLEAIWHDVRDVVWYTGLWQYWDLFSPTPIQYDGWLVVEGQFEDETSYDLLTGRATDYETPTRWYWGPSMRWEKFEENIYNGQAPSLLRGWGNYYCNTLNQNREQGTRLATLTITMVVRDFHAPNQLPNVNRREQVWFHWCFDEYAPQS